MDFSANLRNVVLKGQCAEIAGARTVNVKNVTHARTKGVLVQPTVVLIDNVKKHIPRKNRPSAI